MRALAARWLARLLGAALLLLGLGAGLAQAELAVPPLAARVTDLTGTLNTEQQAALEAQLAAFEQQKGSQIALLLVPSTQPETIEQYAIRVAERWQLGRPGVDDGVLVLLAKDDRAVRIEVGYGLEGAIPDAIAKRVIEDIMIPHLRQGDFAGGLAAGVDSLTGLVEGEPLPAPAAAKARAGSTLEQYLPLLFFGALIGGGLLRTLLGRVMGGLATGGLVGLVVWLLGAGLLFALLLALFACVITLGNGRGFGGGLPRGGSGHWGGGFGGGGFSGGGGGFGGGGASGRW